MDADVIVIGAGHNALITAAYAAQAGYKVIVFERRDIVGGAVSTQEIVPGYRFDLGGSAHILIRLTPIVEELGLEDYGLHYLDLDPLFYAPSLGGDALYFNRSIDDTCQGFEQHMAGEGDAYRAFCDDWQPFASLVREAFLSTPSPLDLGKKMVFGANTPLQWQKALGYITRPYGEVVSEYFRSPQIQASIAWMAAQSGPPPTEPLGGPFALWHPLYHEGGVSRPRGGSGMLTQALRRHIEAHGGTVYTGAPVEEILVEGKKAVGVRALGTTFTARAVVAGGHAVETFSKLLPPDARPPGHTNMRVGNGFGAILRLALDSPVEYANDPLGSGRIGLGLLCDDVSDINAAYGEYLKGDYTDSPPIVAMSFSAVDDTLAPPGGEVLWLWAQYFPYELANGTWDERGDHAADVILDQFEKYAPGTRSKIVGQLFQHPLWLERNLGLFKGNVMHLEMSIDQMFMLRPFVGMAQYTTHLDGLYLTGASTHPGGGIMGASGRNAARVLLEKIS